jgi:phage baseplate assembly protein W
MNRFKTVYKGFSFKNYSKSKFLNVNDVELIKQDLTNHLFTRKGERYGMPNFGTLIPDIIFEQMDEQTIQTVSSEIEFVLNYDPRVIVNSFRVIPLYDESAIVAIADLDFVEINLNDIFHIVIEFQGQ